MTFSVRSTLFILTFLCQLVLSVPAGQYRTFVVPLHKRESQDGPFDTLSFLRKDLEHTISKYFQGFRIYQLNMGMRHPLDNGFYKAFGLGRRSRSSVHLTQDTQKTLWQGAINVGTPSRRFIVDFDTGSSRIFLPGAACTENCNGHHLYDPSASYTSRDYGQTFWMSYEDGSSVTGEVYLDKVSIGRFTASNQTLCVASSYSEDFRVEFFSPDGLVGLAYPSVSEIPAPPLIQQLFAEGRISAPIFGFGFQGGEGLLHVGRSLADIYGPTLFFTPVTEQGFWQVVLDAVSVSSITVVKTQPAVIDTGTTAIIAPTDAANQFYSAIPSSQNLGNGFFAVPCSPMPTISVTFAGQLFAVSPALFNLGPIPGLAGQCYGGVVATDDLNFWVMGDMFLQGVYTEFDFEKNRVGFAQVM